MNEREVVTLDIMHYEELVRNSNMYQELMCKLANVEYQLMRLSDNLERLTNGER